MYSRKSHATDLRRALNWILDKRILPQQAEHGNTRWLFSPLAVTALLWAWEAADGLLDRFRRSRDIVKQIFPQAKPAKTWNGFIKALDKKSDLLLRPLRDHLRCLMRNVSETDWTIGRWTVLAVDGTRITLPRTPENQHGYSTPETEGKVPPCPQLWLTVLWHVGLGLPWSWRHGPGNSSARHQLQQMLDEFPEEVLLTADAGFQGYDLWNDLIEHGHALLIRVGTHVRLLNEWGYIRSRDGIVCLWPDKSQRKKQAPIVLRLLAVETNNQKMYLVTNVMDRSQLSVRDALEIYRRRWGVEVFFRELKETFARDRLKSRTPQHVVLELEWSLMALWSVQLLGVKELVARNMPPTELSLARGLKALRNILQAVLPPPEKSLFEGLAAIRDDGYQRRCKSVRDYPRKRKREKPPSAPQLTRMTQEQRELWKQLKTQTD